MAVYNSTYTGAQIDNLLLKSGGTMTGPLIINGTASSNPLVLRGITGSDGLGNPGDLYLNYQRAGFVDMLNNKVKVTATATYLNQLTELNGTLSVVDSYIIRNTVKYDGTMSNNGLSSGTEYPSTLIINDKNGLGLARVEGIIGSDGNIGVNMYARNYDSTGAQLAQCSIRA